MLRVATASGPIPVLTQTEMRVGPPVKPEGYGFFGALIASPQTLRLTYLPGDSASPTTIALPVASPRLDRGAQGHERKAGCVWIPPLRSSRRAKESPSRGMAVEREEVAARNARSLYTQYPRTSMIPLALRLDRRAGPARGHGSAQIRCCGWQPRQAPYQCSHKRKCEWALRSSRRDTVFFGALIASPQTLHLTYLPGGSASPTTITPSTASPRLDRGAQGHERKAGCLWIPPLRSSRRAKGSPSRGMAVERWEVAAQNTRSLYTPSLYTPCPRI